MAEILKTGEAMASALALLEAGGIVAIPTETVYGLAGDATNGEAVARIFEAKGRPRFNPLIAHVSGLVMASEIAVFDTLSEKLAEAFWPGPLTLVLPLAEGAAIHPLVTAGLDTIALRMPQGFGAGLIARFGRPLAAPSANSSGRITSTTAEAVEADLGKRIPLIVDGGPTQVGLESTIVKVEAGTLRLLRPGGIAAEVIEAAAGRPLLRGASAGVEEAPGMLASHYAPGAAVRVGATMSCRARRCSLSERSARKVPRRRSPCSTCRPRAICARPRPTSSPICSASTAAAPRTIAVEPVPDTGLGEAINDRLSRAAAPRDNPADNP